jgi:16S rRNA (cytidine1402-2'-O)-methyltransferase
MTLSELYLCPTPLGNLEDITMRTLSVLKKVPLIAAEDTRHTRKLLNHYDITTKLTSYHEHNKHKKTIALLEFLLSGNSLALVSDAGMPGISDPGEDLVREAVARGIKVIALPGASAVITALAASGMPAVPFAFYGFGPTRGKKRKQFLQNIVDSKITTVFFEAPHRLVKTLSFLAAIDPHRQIVIARELTKVYEEYVRGSLSVVLEHFEATEPLGECTVVFAGNPKEEQQVLESSLEDTVKELLATGMSKKEAAREAASRFNLSRRNVYQTFFAKKNSSIE